MDHAGRSVVDGKRRELFGSRINYRMGLTGEVEFATGFPPAFLIAHRRMTDGRTFYDQRAPFRLRESERAYHQLLKKYYAFLVPPGLRVLELGCGLGDLLAATQPARGVGVDFSPAIIELARQRHPGLEFQVAEATNLAGDERFDYVILSDLLNDGGRAEAFRPNPPALLPAHAAGLEFL